MYKHEPFTNQVHHNTQMVTMKCTGIEVCWQGVFKMNGAAANSAVDCELSQQVGKTLFLVVDRIGKD